MANGENKKIIQLNSHVPLLIPWHLNWGEQPTKGCVEKYCLVGVLKVRLSFSRILPSGRSPVIVAWVSILEYPQLESKIITKELLKVSTISVSKEFKTQARSVGEEEKSKSFSHGDQSGSEE